MTTSTNLPPVNCDEERGETKKWRIDEINRGTSVRHRLLGSSLNACNLALLGSGWRQCFHRSAAPHSCQYVSTKYYCPALAIIRNPAAVKIPRSWFFFLKTIDGYFDSRLGKEWFQSAWKFEIYFNLSHLYTD